VADDLKRTLRAVKRAGWTVTRRGGHLLLDSPDGQRVVSCATRAGGRAHQNFLGQLKRAGLDLRDPHQRPRRRKKP
jgi:predicted RNA binding protein YcfA (HicA-like mRNA interferase family)